MIWSSLLWILVIFPSPTFQSPEKTEAAFEAFDPARAKHLFDMANAVEDEDPLQAVSYAEEGLSIAKASGNREQEANHLGSLGYNYQVLGDYAKALRFQNEALSIRRELQDQQGQAKSLNNIGIVYYFLGHPDLALGAFLQALRLRQDIGDRVGLGKTYNNMGLVYQALEQYDKSMECYQSALEIKREFQDQVGETRTLSNIGQIYLKKNELDLALDFQTRAKTLAESIGFTNGVAYADNNIGDLYRMRGSFEKALNYYRLALTAYQSMSDPHGMVEALNNMGAVLGEQGKLTEAISVLDFAVGQATAINAMPKMRDSFELLSVTYRKMGDFQKTLEHFQKYVDLQTKLRNEQVGIRIAEMEIRHEMDQKEREIELLKKDRSIQQLTLKRQKTQMNSILVGVVLLTLLAVTFYKAYQTKLHAHQALLEKNNQIAKSNDALAFANKQNQANHDKLKEAYRMMEVLAHTDPLTRLANRRKFRQHCLEAVKEGRSFSIVLGDIDRFKRINDEHGHEMGDLVLKTISDLLSMSIREKDLACRWGGEEFIIFLDEVGLEKAVNVAERIRKSFAKKPTVIQGKNVHATVSFGVTIFNEGTLDACIAVADELLYRAKAKGGNQVCHPELVPS